MDNTANLQSYIDRLVKIKTEVRELNDIGAEIKAEAKSVGFDPGAIDEIVARIVAKEELLKKRKQREEIARVYAEAIGQLSLFN